MRSFEEDRDTAEDSICAMWQSTSCPSQDIEFGCASPAESVNRLFTFYRLKAQRDNKPEAGQSPAKSKSTKNSTRTMPPSLRKKVLLRDGGRCPPCGGRQAPGCGRTKFIEVHHIRAVGAGGKHDLTNTLTLCSTCHTRVHEGRISVEGEAPERLRWRRT
jgi:predicted restriction endonuclease